MRVFISQGVIDSWISADRVEVTGERLMLPGGAGTLRLETGVYFRSVATGGDTNRLLGRIKAGQAVAALGGETYLNSVIMGDTAYEVEPGFVATPEAPTVDSRRALLEGLRVLGS